MKNNKLNVKDVLDVTFEDLTFKGLGVAKVEGLPIFVEGALPTESGRIRIEKVENRYAFGSLLELFSRSEDRVDVKDKHKVLNSTLPLQHLSYAKQLEFKTKIVKDAFEKTEGLKDFEVVDTIGSANEWHYRNKTSVPVRLVDKKLETGIFEVRSKKLTPVDNFKINNEGIDEIVSKVRDILITFNEKPYDERTHTGNIRHIVVRKGYYTDEVMIIIVTRSKSLFPTSKIVPAILESVDNVVSLVHNINGKRSSDILGDTSVVLHGEDAYAEKMLGLDFQVPSQAFLQVNTPQAEVLYQHAIDLLDLQGHELVLDAYCGIGTISLSLAQKAKEVVGVEIVEDAVNMARENAKRNNIDNARFEVGRVEEVVETLNLKPDAIVVDPPRKGLEPEFINTLVKMNPEKIVYVSCNPTTLARDVQLLVDAGYQANSVQAVDMFPQTVHVESVVLLHK